MNQEHEMLTSGGKKARFNPAVYKVPALGFLFSLVLLLLITVMSNPATGGPIVMLLFLLAVFLCFLSGVAGVMQATLTLMRRPPLSRLRLLYTSVAIAAGVVFLIGLQTLRQLQVIDMVLVIIFEVILNFYLLRRF